MSRAVKQYLYTTLQGTLLDLDKLMLHRRKDLLCEKLVHMPLFKQVPEQPNIVGIHEDFVTSCLDDARFISPAVPYLTN